MSGRGAACGKAGNSGLEIAIGSRLLNDAGGSRYLVGAPTTQGDRVPLPTMCPACRAVRAPNARFCQQCGHDFEALVAGSDEWSREAAQKIELQISVWTGFKFGLGLALAGLVVGILAALASYGIVASFIDALSRTFR